MTALAMELDHHGRSTCQETGDREHPSPPNPMWQLGSLFLSHVWPSHVPNNFFSFLVTHTQWISECRKMIRKARSLFFVHYSICNFFCLFLFCSLFPVSAISTCDQGPILKPKSNDLTPLLFVLETLQFISLSVTKIYILKPKKKYKVLSKS